MRLPAVATILALSVLTVIATHGANLFIYDKEQGLQYISKYVEEKGVKPLTGVAQIDSYIHVLIFLFRDHVLINPAMWWLFGEWVVVFAALNWLNVEFFRTQMRFIWAYFFLWYFGGLAIALSPVLIYYVVAKEKRVSFGLPSRPIPVGHSLITVIRVVISMAAAFVWRWTSPESKEHFWVSVAFFCGPVLLDFVWAVLPSGSSSAEDSAVSQALLRLSFVITAVCGSIIHIYEIFRLLEHFGGTTAIISDGGAAIFAELASNASCWHIVYDATCSLAAIFVFVFYHGGLAAGFKCLLNSIILGPAVAITAYFAQCQSCPPAASVAKKQN